MEKFRDQEKNSNLAKPFLSLKNQKKFSSHKRINSGVEVNLLTEETTEAFEPALYTSTSMNFSKGLLSTGVDVAIRNQKPHR